MNETPNTLVKHDFKILAFHLAVVAIQSVLIALKVENFGTMTPYIAMVVNIVLEGLRRWKY